MVCRCPNCRVRLDLELLMQEEAGIELQRVLGRLDTLTRAALAAYLGLFRAENRDLASDRALRLACEVLALTSDLPRLGKALADTVESIRSSERNTQMRNHNYLRKVLENTPSPSIEPRRELAVPPKTVSKTASAVTALLGDTSYAGPR